MNKKVLHTLEFDKIAERLSDKATSDKGREYCLKIKPISDIKKIKERQKETEDALGRIIRSGSVSFSGIHDVSLYEKRLSIGSALNAAELLQIASLLTVTERAVRYGSSDDEDEKRDSLSHYFDELEPAEDLHREIDRCILSEDEIADDASSGLKNVRRQMSLINDRIRSQMNSMLNNPSVRDCLQDAVITTRDGRYCLPVRAEYKSQVPGMVHDQSGSGATLFIEPMAVVNMNNEFRELEIKEKAEIEKILASLSEQAAQYISSLTEDFKILSELDFIFAKGQLALEENAVIPVFNDEGRINLRKARHPLLDPQKVVPIDVNLGIDFDLLIITGPNTGGKTVSLKTVGLLTLMGQSGLHIPAGDRSELAVFNEVYADIGDEQSIEQSLSTFSSHMTNIVKILSDVYKVPHSLVLFDELCAGTDPSEGAALATSILERLRQLDVRTMATTHYPELKTYALTTSQAENASCEFSVETLSPTYRLMIGIPGKSNAFAISKKLGLADDLIADAENRMQEEDRNFEDLVSELEEKRIAIEKEKEASERDREKAAKYMKDAENRKDNLDDRKDRIIAEANRQAAEILQRAKDKADEVIRNFNKYGQAAPDMARMERERQAIGAEVKNAQKQAAVTRRKSVKSSGKSVDARKLRIGDEVIVLSMNLKGTVHTLPDKKGNLTVSIGIMKTKVNIDDIMTVEETGGKFSGKASSGSRQGSGVRTGSLNKSLTISPELMLLGMTVDEAIIALDKYLDDARLSHLDEVRIVHGKGTGALRSAVQDYLRTQKDIKGFHLGEYGEGDSGVTIVEL